MTKKELLSLLAEIDDNDLVVVEIDLSGGYSPKHVDDVMSFELLSSTKIPRRENAIVGRAYYPDGPTQLVIKTHADPFKP